MTGGWGKKVAAFIIGAATLGTANSTADAQQASADVSVTQNQTGTLATGTQTTGTQQAQSGVVQNSAQATAQAAAQAAARQPGLRIIGSVRTSLEFDDNRAFRTTSAGTDTRWFTTFGIGLISETPTEQFQLNFDADLQFEDFAASREENGVENPTLNFRYNRNAADSRLSFSGLFRTDDILDSFFFDSDGDLIQDTLLQSDGDQTDINFGAQYSFGLQAPFGMDFTLNRRERRYSNVVSPNLFDEQTDRLGITGRFRISPTVAVRAFINETRYDADDSVSTQRDTTDFGAGVAYEIRPDLSFDGQISFTDIVEETTTGAGQTVTENDGYNASFGLTRTLTNGTLAFSVNRNQGLSTARTDLRVDRSMTLPSGSLSFGVGVSDSDTGSSTVIASLDYTNQLATGFLTANLARTARITTNNDEVVRTIAGLNYNHPINPVSSLNFGLTFAQIDDGGAGAIQEGRRADFRVGYRRQLTPDWDWSIAYVNRNRRGTTGSSTNSNSVVASVGRSFSIRP